MRFCQSFTLELQRHIGGFTDVPAGDIGVGGREIGYMFGTYKRVKNVVEGVLTGKGLAYGGSLIRPEATGYGLIYFVIEMLKTRNEEIKGKRALVSGSGNVAQYTCEKLLQLGATPLAVSDSKGVLVFKDGLTFEHVEIIKALKNDHRVPLKKISELYPNISGYEYLDGKSIWDISIKYELALPCATQNEILPQHVPIMVENGVTLVAEGANMPSTNETIELYLENNIFYAPGKAANAGGASVSGLEMSQNSIRLSWSSEKVDRKLNQIMKSIFTSVNDASKTYGVPFYQGANIAGFKKVADAMLSYGVV
jgi:glutamate dehydrogenase (NADP+)